MNQMPAETFPVLSDVLFDGVLVRFAAGLTEPGNRAALAFAEAVRAHGWPGVQEVATGPVSVLVRIDVLDPRRDELLNRLKALLGTCDWLQAEAPGGRALWTVPVSFGGVDGPQLEEAAGLAGRDAAAAVEDLCAAPLRVLTLGFAPGQPYLGQLPEHWDLPRQTGLTPKVPEGAVTVAVRQIVLFANPSPTGWRQVGRAAFRLFRPEADEPFPLRPGDQVLFRAVSAEALAGLGGDPDGGAMREDLS